MNLEPTAIEGAGDIERERVVMKATSDCDLGYFALVKSVELTDGIASGNQPAMYWFPGKKVKAGDFVVVYSKTGTRSEKKSDSGVTSHFFYWGQAAPLWFKGSLAMLVETPMWKSLKMAKE